MLLIITISPNFIVHPICEHLTLASSNDSSGPPPMTLLGICCSTKSAASVLSLLWLEIGVLLRKNLIICYWRLHNVRPSGQERPPGTPSRNALQVCPPGTPARNARQKRPPGIPARKARAVARSSLSLFCFYSSGGIK